MDIYRLLYLPTVRFLLLAASAAKGHHIASSKCSSLVACHAGGYISMSTSFDCPPGPVLFCGPHARTHCCRERGPCICVRLDGRGGSTELWSTAQHRTWSACGLVHSDGAMDGRDVRVESVRFLPLQPCPSPIPSEPPPIRIARRSRRYQYCGCIDCGCSRGMASVFVKAWSPETYDSADEPWTDDGDRSGLCRPCMQIGVPFKLDDLERRPCLQRRTRSSVVCSGSEREQCIPVHLEKREGCCAFP
jgi:hypothetical protein